MTVARITPAMLRAGEPEALAVLCQRRGPAVCAYCERVVGPDHATAAAASTFAQFRLATLAPGSLTGAQQAERLMRTLTRRAALSHAVASSGARAGGPVPEPCDMRQRLMPLRQRRGNMYHAPSSSNALLRGAARLLAVVVAAGAAGILLGMALAELTR